MMPRFRPAWLILAALGVAMPRPPALAGPGDRPPGAPHEFHVTYGRMGVEGSIIQVRLRFFADDLALALERFSGETEVSLAPDPRTDSLVTRYLGARFQVRAGGEPVGEDPLEGRIVASGEESDGTQQLWWYVLEYEAPVKVEHVRVDARVLLELFEDQRNILRIVYFPSGSERTFYLTDGSSEAAFDL